MSRDRNNSKILHVVDHPLVQHKLTLLRDKETNTSQFRQILREIGLLMGYEVTRGLPIKPRIVETPMAPARATSSSRTIWLLCPFCEPVLVWPTVC